MIHFNFWPTLAFVGISISWVAFVITFMGHKKPPTPPEKKRDSSSIVGIVFQGLSYAALWIIRRQWFTSIFGSSKFSEIALAVLTIVLAATSVWFCAAAI